MTEYLVFATMTSSYYNPNLSASTLVSSTTIESNASISSRESSLSAAVQDKLGYSKDPEAALAVLQQQMGFGNSGIGGFSPTFCPIPPTMTRDTRSSKSSNSSSNASSRKSSPASTKRSSVGSAGDKENRLSSRGGLSDKDFMRSYGLGGLQLDGANVKSFKASSRNTSESDKKAKKEKKEAAKAEQQQKQKHGNSTGLSDKEFMRSYGLGGMSFEGNNLNHFTGASIRLSASKSKSSSSEASSSAESDESHSSSSSSTKQRLAAMLGLGSKKAA